VVPSERAEEGFTLIEVLVALVMLAAVCLVAATFMVGAVRTTGELSHKQNATALATQALEAVQATPHSALLTGRTQASVQALLANTWFAPLVVEDVVTSDNFDPAATAASVANVPVTTTQTLARTTYTVHTSINRCFLSRTTQTCTRLAAPDGISVLRATVQVVWGEPACGDRCRYAASALLDTQPDPVFELATSRPIIVSMTPDVVRAKRPVQVVLTGTGFKAGLTLTTSEGNEGISSLVRNSDGTQVSFKYTPGSAPGAFTLILRNPDTGRAEYNPVTVQP